MMQQKELNNETYEHRRYPSSSSSSPSEVYGNIRSAHTRRFQIRWPDLPYMDDSRPSLRKHSTSNLGQTARLINASNKETTTLLTSVSRIAQLCRAKSIVDFCRSIGKAIFGNDETFL